MKQEMTEDDFIDLALWWMTEANRANQNGCRGRRPCPGSNPGLQCGPCARYYHACVQRNLAYEEADKRSGMGQ